MTTEVPDVNACPHCGQELRKYWHKLTPGLVNALVKFSRAIGAKGRNSVHLRDDMEGKDFELTFDERSNFTKLRMHGLVAKDKEAGRGTWVLTAKGASFLRGYKRIPSKVLTFNNHIEEHGGELISIYDVYRRDVPHFEQVQDIEYEVVPQEGLQAKMF